jgi:hypothetical protein
VAAQATASRPILLVVNDSASNKFGRYLGEILRAEGLNSFDVTTVFSTTPAQLAGYRLVILAETTLTAYRASLLSNYVTGGGALIAMRPDAQIKGLFGLNTASGTVTDGYLKINTAVSVGGFTPGQGLASATLQIHGDADAYTLAGGAVKLADLYSSATTSTPYPAVVSSASGKAVAFTYDLARNVVYTRQGNPANAGIDIDGDGVLRTVDLFQTSGGGAPWVNRDRIPIPQADEQQRLFARLVKGMLAPSLPMPQLWYFPGSAKSVLVSTGDAHANPVSWYQDVLDIMNARQAPITLYLAIGAPNNTYIQTWRGQGHEFGLHPYAFRPDPYPPYNITNLTQGFQVFQSWYSTTYSSPPSRTVRNHQLAWLGWTDAASLAVSHGMALDANFYHWGAWLKKPDNSWPHGYITGSGQPMKFVRSNGAILPYYQQLTQLVDEQLVQSAGAGYENLTPAGAVQVSQQLIDASLAGDYAAIMTQFHVDYVNQTSAWIDGTLAYAASKGVPLLNADRWLKFVETRNGANYNTVAWDSTNNRLTFNIQGAAAGGVNLTTMLPFSYNGNGLQSVRVDGVNTGYSVQTIKGVSLAFVSVPSGNHSFVATYNVPVSPPRNYYTSLPVKLTWNRLSFATAYEVQVDTSSNFDLPLDFTATTNANTLTATIPTLANGVYSWRVRAKNPAGQWGPWSTVEAFTLAAP